MSGMLNNDDFAVNRQIKSVSNPSVSVSVHCVQSLSTVQFSSVTTKTFFKHIQTSCSGLGKKPNTADELLYRLILVYVLCNLMTKGLMAKEID